MTQLTEILQFAQTGVWIAALVFIRISAAMALMPAFGEQILPMRVKLAAALAFTLVVAPVAWSDLSAAYESFGWLKLIATEVIAGLLIGILFRLFIIVLQIAGTVAAQSTSLSQIFGAGLGAEPQPAMSTLLVVAGLCLAVLAGLHVRIVEALIQSYSLFEPGRPISSVDVSQWGIGRVGYTFGLGLSLAAPFVLASLIYNLALGAINRAMPQLMVAFVGAPAISLGGLVILMLVAPLMLAIWLSLFFEHISLEGGAI